MNTENRIYSRLLKLFPVKIIKDYYNLVGNQDDIIQKVVAAHNTHNLHSFCRNHMAMTKQHIYVYSHGNVNFGSVTRAVFNASSTVIHEETTQTSKSFYLLFDIDYQLALTNPYGEGVISYKWPVKVTITSTHVIIHVTVLERNPSAEFGDRKVFVTDRSIDEDDVLASIETALNRFSIIVRCDINRGVKRLWQADTIDARTARFKKARSVSSETMDEDFTVKATMPEVYAELVLTPLRTTVFKVINNVNGRYVDHLTIDPSSGLISVTIYPKDTAQIQNTIEDIIQNN